MPTSTLVVVWRVNEQCNLGCHFCGYSRHLERARVSADPRQLLAFGALLGQYQAHSGRPVLVSWVGGEPLVWKPLAELSRVFKEQYRLLLGVTTNGVPFGSPAVRQHLVAVYDQVTVSVDGIATMHDQLRDAPGLYERLRADVTELSRQAAHSGRSLLLRVNTILMRRNIGAFEDLCRQVAAWGVREVTFNQLGGNDRPEFYPDNRLLPEQVEWFRGELPRIRSRLAALGLVIQGSASYLERIACTARGERIPVADCDPGRDFLFIDERGTVSPCSFTVAGYGFPLEQVNDVGGLERLPGLFRQRRRHLLPPCLDCPSTHVFAKFRLQ